MVLKQKLNILKEEDDEEETYISIITTGRDINDDGIVTYEPFFFFKL